MKIRIALFAAARQITEKSEIELELAPGSTIADLETRLCEIYPDISDLISRSLFAIDHEYVETDTPVCESSEIAMIPPVSGG